MTRSAKVKRQCLSGASCVRCGRRYRLECHHVVSLQFGGQDTLENTVALCHDCHKDWHNVYDPLKADNQAEWNHFLKADHPAIGAALVKAIVSGEVAHAQMSPDEALELARTAWQTYVSLRNSGWTPDEVVQIVGCL